MSLFSLTHDDNYENTFEFNGAGSLYTPSHTKLCPERVRRDHPDAGQSLTALYGRSGANDGSPIGAYEFYLYPASTAADCIPFLPEIGDLPQRLYDARTDDPGRRLRRC